MFMKGGMVSGGQNAAVSSPVSTVMVGNRHKSFVFSHHSPLSPVCCSDLANRAAISDLPTANWGGEVVTKSLCTLMNI